jgi:hypothetical protein
MCAIPKADFGKRCGLEIPRALAQLENVPPIDCPFRRANKAPNALGRMASLGELCNYPRREAHSSTRTKLSIVEGVCDRDNAGEPVFGSFLVS